ncbi:MAG: RsmE family RNA methyltransferase [Elusimicrobiota bacterium]
MIKIFVDESLTEGIKFGLSGENNRHLRVLRVSTGDEIIVGDRDFTEYYATVAGYEKGMYLLETGREKPDAILPSRHVALYVSVPKKQKLEDIVFRCTQIGISEFNLLTSERTVKILDQHNIGKTIERCVKKARAASELCGRKYIPRIGSNIEDIDISLENFRKKGFSSGIFLWEESAGEYISGKDLSDRIAVFVGPEGGFTEREAQKAIGSGLVVRSMGRLVMDVETACMAASALLLNQGI